MTMNRGWARSLVPAVCTVLAAGVVIMLVLRFGNYAADAPLLRDSTLGELAVWMADQAEEDVPESLLRQWAKGQQSDDLEVSLTAGAQRVMILVVVATAVCAGAALVGMMTGARWVRTALVISLVFAASLLFLVPTIAGDNTLLLVLLACLLLVLAYVFAPGKITRAQSFVVVLC